MTTNRFFLKILTLCVSASALGLSAVADLGENIPAPRSKPRAEGAVAAAITPAPAIPAFINSDATMLLVVPSRYTVVQLAFDMAKFRPMAIVAYDDNPTGKVSRIHVWDSVLEDWQRMEMSEFKNASFMRTAPKDLLVIGNDVPGLADAATWASTKKRVPTFNLVGVINTLDDILEFTNDEWKTLARKYDLKLKDQNEQRRRQGRWGTSNKFQKPREEAAMPPPAKAEPAPDESEKIMAPLPPTTPPPTSRPISEVIIPEPAPVTPPVAPRSKAPIAPEDK